MKKIVLLVIIATLSQASVAQCLNYSQLLNSSFRKIAFFDTNYGFTFGQGTLMTTSDGGTNWSFVTVPSADIYIENLKAYDMIDVNSAIIVGQSGTMLKTTDKGQTWTRISIGINGNENINCVDFVDSNIGYLTVYTYTPQVSYFMKTVDGGLTWTQIPTHFSSDINFYSDVSLHFFDELNGFAWSGFYFYKTIDGGNTWILVPNPSGTNIFDYKRISTMKVAENGTIVLSFYDGIAFFYQSTDSGNSWQIISNLSPSNDTFINNPVFDIKDNKLLVVGSIGNTINKSFIKNDLIDNQFTSYPLGEGLWRQSDVSFINSEMGFIIDSGNSYWSDTPGRKILKTTNGGLNWNEFDSFSLTDHGSVNNIKVLVNNPTTLTLTKQDNYNGAFTDFSLYTSTDGGATWQHKLTEQDLQGVLLKAEDNYISYVRLLNPFNGGGGYSLYESYDLGTTWTHSDFEAQNANFYDFEQLDFNTLRCGYNSQLHLSFDKGQTWTQITMPVIPNINIYKSKMKSLNEIYAWGQANGWPTVYDYYLYRTTDLGQSWQLVSMIPDNNGADLGAIAASTFFGSNYAFVSTGGNTYFKVDLNTNTYQPVPFTNPIGNGVYVNENSLNILNDNKWLMNTESGYKISTDQGQTWTDQNCLVCGNNIIYDDTSNVLISYDNEHGVERIGNYASSIPIIYGNSNVDINTTTSYFVPVDPLMATEWSLDSGGIITTNSNNFIQINWTQEGQHSLRAKYVNNCGETAYYELLVNVTIPLSVGDNHLSKITVFPNPFKDLVNIQAKYETASSVISIYNVIGQLVYTDSIPKNELTTISNLGYLVAGTYFLVLKNNNETFVNKLIKE